MQALVHEALDALEPIDREIIWLIHFDGLKPKEAAEVLGIRRGAAYTRYHRALTRFRELLPDSLRQEETNHDANLDQSA
jgi:RNA polymerase sigma-70 factor (ECF subfamily)